MEPIAWALITLEGCAFVAVVFVAVTMLTQDERRSDNGITNIARKLLADGVRARRALGRPQLPSQSRRPLRVRISPSRHAIGRVLAQE
jgi:hypothetical protein